jgi:hypothetical protein
MIWNYNLWIEFKIEFVFLEFTSLHVFILDVVWTSPWSSSNWSFGSLIDLESFEGKFIIGDMCV